MREMDKNSLIKERNRLVLRNEHLVSLNEKLSEENRAWKLRYDEIAHQYRRSKRLCRYPDIEEFQIA